MDKSEPQTSGNELGNPWPERVSRELREAYKSQVVEREGAAEHGQEMCWKSMAYGWLLGQGVPAEVAQNYAYDLWY